MAADEPDRLESAAPVQSSCGAGGYPEDRCGLGETHQTTARALNLVRSCLRIGSGRAGAGDAGHGLGGLVSRTTARGINPLSSSHVRGGASSEKVWMLCAPGKGSQHLSVEAWPGSLAPERATA